MLLLLSAVLDTCTDTWSPDKKKGQPPGQFGTPAPGASYKIFVILLYKVFGSVICCLLNLPFLCVLWVSCSKYCVSH